MWRGVNLRPSRLVELRLLQDSAPIDPTRILVSTSDELKVGEG